MSGLAIRSSHGLRSLLQTQASSASRKLRRELLTWLWGALDPLDPQPGSSVGTLPVGEEHPPSSWAGTFLVWKTAKTDMNMGPGYRGRGWEGSGRGAGGHRGRTCVYRDPQKGGLKMVDDFIESLKEVSRPQTPTVTLRLREVDSPPGL